MGGRLLRDVTRRVSQALCSVNQRSGEAKNRLFRLPPSRQLQDSTKQRDDGSLEDLVAVRPPAILPLARDAKHSRRPNRVPDLSATLATRFFSALLFRRRHRKQTACAGARVLELEGRGPGGILGRPTTVPGRVPWTLEQETTLALAPDGPFKPDADGAVRRENPVPLAWTDRDKSRDREASLGAGWILTARDDLPRRVETPRGHAQALPGPLRSPRDSNEGLFITRCVSDASQRRGSPVSIGAQELSAPCSFDEEEGAEIDVLLANPPTGHPQPRVSTPRRHCPRRLGPETATLSHGHGRADGRSLVSANGQVPRPRLAAPRPDARLLFRCGFSSPDDRTPVIRS